MVTFGLFITCGRKEEKYINLQVPLEKKVETLEKRVETLEEEIQDLRSAIGKM